MVWLRGNAIKILLLFFWQRALTVTLLYNSQKMANEWIFAMMPCRTVISLIKYQYIRGKKLNENTRQICFIGWFNIYSIMPTFKAPSKWECRSFNCSINLWARASCLSLILCTFNLLRVNNQTVAKMNRDRNMHTHTNSQSHHQIYTNITRLTRDMIAAIAAAAAAAFIAAVPVNK